MHKHVPACSGTPTDYGSKNQNNIVRMKQTAILEKGLGFVQKRNKVGHGAVSEATGFHAVLGQI